ncbi:MAG: aromatic amino acid transaminase [Pseudomonadota bacterium]
MEKSDAFMFNNLDTLPEDPLLGLTQAYRNDPCEEKIDLGVGVFKTPDGTTPIMRAVKEAERRLTAAQQTKVYAPPVSVPGYIDHLSALVFGDAPASDASCRIGVQAPGGCGALRLGAELLARRGAQRVLVGAPTWANHIPLMEAAGLRVEQEPFYNKASGTQETGDFLTAVEQLGPEDCLLLHGACHNPTGADLSSDDANAILDLAQRRGFLVFIDVAYHGFAQDLEADRAIVRQFAAGLPELMISYSCSKNFGLYRERTGAIFVQGQSERVAMAAQSHLINIARGSYSMPPAHGASIVAEILQADDLRKDWRDELSTMAQTVREKRVMLVAAARETALGEALDFVAQQNGMFSLIPVSKEQVSVLRKDFGIYMADSGRINLCGLTEANVGQFVHALATV